MARGRWWTRRRWPHCGTCGLRSLRPRLVGHPQAGGRVATNNGLLAPGLAGGIQRVKSAKSIGGRAGDWPTLRHANALPNAPDIATLKGLRDRAIVAVLLGCALAAVRGGSAHDGHCSGAFAPEATVAARHANTPELAV